MTPTTCQPSADDQLEPSTSDASQGTSGGSAPAGGGGALNYVQSLGGLPTTMLNHLRTSSNTFRSRFTQSSSPMPDLLTTRNPTVVPGCGVQSIPAGSDNSTTSSPNSNLVDQPRPPVEQSLLLDLTNLGIAPATNAGPSVHISTDEVESKDVEGSESKESSDDESMPPAWITRKVYAPAKASMVSPTISGASSPAAASPVPQTRSTPVISPMQAQSSLDSQSLLRAQLLKSQAQHNLRRRAEPRQISVHHSASSSSSICALPQPTSSTHQLMSNLGSETHAVMLDARKYFILTSAGKPVWSTEDDCEDREGGDTTGLMGLMQAIISIFEDDGDELRYIDSGAVKIAVMLKPPLYLLAVSNWGEPESFLRLHLDYLYLLIQSIVSLTQLHKLFDRRQNHDLRRTLTGTESIFRVLVNKLQWDFSIMMSSLEVYSCPRNIRNTISRIVTPISISIGTSASKSASSRFSKTDGVLGTELDDEEENRLNLEEVARKLLYSIVLVHGKVACLVRPKSHSVHPSDLQLIITTVLSSSLLQNSESWVPICLPCYNSTGFLHAYVTFFPPPASHIGLLFVSGDRSGFFRLKQWAEQIARHQIWRDLTPSSDPEALKVGFLSDNGAGYSLEQVGIPSLRHFVYKHKTHVQVTSPVWEDDYLDLENRRRLVTTYQRAYDLMHPKLSRVEGDPRPPLTFLYLRNEKEGIIGWNTTTHELYMAVSPMLSKTAAVSAAHAVVKWIKGHEDSLFLTSAPAF